MLAMVITSVLYAAPSPKGLTLTGTVTDKAGRPLPSATIFVRTAAPRKGIGVL